MQRILFNINEHLNKQFFYRPKEIEAVESKKMLLEIKKILECKNNYKIFYLPGISGKRL
jgi:hypothetical protein